MCFTPSDKEFRTNNRLRLQNEFNKQVSEDINNIATELNSVSSGGDVMVESVNGQTGIVVLDKSDIGLSNVDNTSDVDKPISNAVQNALNNKQNSLPTPANTNQYLKSNFSWSDFPIIPVTLSDLDPPEQDINMNLISLYNLLHLKLSDLGTDPDLPTSSGSGGIIYVKNGALMYANSNGVIEIAKP